MRHGNSKFKLSKSSSHRKAILINLLRSIAFHKSIKTTLTKAKFVKPHVDKIITIAKSYQNNPLFAIRRLNSILGDEKLTTDLIQFANSSYKERLGGYSRIIKLGFRKGDKASIAIVQFV